MYIHYGAKEFDRTKFAPIKNRTCGSKPFGGLWASPVDAAFGWKEWNKIEEFHTCDPKNAFRFTLAEGARVLRIDSLDKLSEIPVNKPAYHFDFEDVAKRYDAVECCLSEVPALYNALYGWDCDSILVLNQDVIVPVPDEEHCTRDASMELLIAVFDRIEAEMGRLYWNRFQKEFLSPFQNTGTFYKDGTFEVNAYAWDEALNEADSNDKPHFSYKDGEFAATWYKHSHRCLECVTPETLTPDYLAKMLSECLASMRNNPHFNDHNEGDA